jgi:hypothetical protein
MTLICAKHFVYSAGPGRCFVCIREEAAADELEDEQLATARREAEQLVWTMGEQLRDARELADELQDKLARLHEPDIIGAALPVCRVCRSPLREGRVPQGTETNT